MKEIIHFLFFYKQKYIIIIKNISSALPMWVPILKKNDKSREWINISKLIWTCKLICTNKVQNIMEFVPKFSEIDFQKYKNLGKKGIILDVDECIAQHHGEILEENFILLQKLIQQNWKIIIYSNMQESSRYDWLKLLWVEVYTGKAKPSKKGFLECLKILSLEKSQVLCIWDNPATDGWAMKRWVWIDYLCVEAISTLWEKKSVSRKIQTGFRNYLVKKYKKKHK